MNQHPRLAHLLLAGGLVLLAGCGAGEAAGTSRAPATPLGSPVAPVATGGALPHWTYEGAEGPEYWGALAEDWKTCTAGREQSPIDITEGVPGEDAPVSLQFDYKPSTYQATDTGHTVQVGFVDAGTLTIDDTPYQLAQVHFHSPSEHTVDAAAYPMEYHLVHKSAAGDLAVIGVFVQWGAENETMGPVFEALPAPGATVSGVESMDPAALLPENLSMVRYDGSLTTPPCSEGVKWHVLMAPVQMSRTQIAAFVARHPHSRRPVQETADRRPVIAIDTSTAAGDEQAGH